MNQNLEKNINDLLTLNKPSEFLESYPQILRELNRRNAFNNFISKQLQDSKYIKDLNQVIEEEKLKRKDFVV